MLSVAIIPYNSPYINEPMRFLRMSRTTLAESKVKMFWIQYFPQKVCIHFGVPLFLETPTCAESSSNLRFPNAINVIPRPVAAERPTTPVQKRGRSRRCSQCHWGTYQKCVPIPKRSLCYTSGEPTYPILGQGKTTVKIQAIACRTGTGIRFSSQLDFSFCWVGQIVDVYPNPTPPRIRINSFGGSKTLGA